MSENKVFQYVQFKSLVHPDFWYKLAAVKLEIERLDEGRRRIHGVCFDSSQVNSIVLIDETLDFRLTAITNR